MLPDTLSPCIVIYPTNRRCMPIPMQAHIQLLACHQVQLPIAKQDERETEKQDRLEVATSADSMYSNLLNT